MDIDMQADTSQFEHVTRREIEHLVAEVYPSSSFGKPDLKLIQKDGVLAIVKDYRRTPFLFRSTVGAWLIGREYKFHRKLVGVQGVPRILRKLDRYANVFEYVNARPIERSDHDILGERFFENLHERMERIHTRGIVHLDLSHKGNILVSKGGDPIIIDFNSGFYVGNGFIGRKLLLPLLQRIDYYGILKLKKRLSPDALTPDEQSYLKRFGLIRRLWFFN
jgi:serine/threonine protein kinase